MPDPSERIGRLETAQEGFHEELADIRATLKTIQESLSSRSRTDWSVIFSGLMVVGALYAAAIHPLHDEIQRHNKVEEKLAEQNVQQNDRLSTIRETQMRIEVDLQNAKEKLRDIVEHGSPITDRRLSLLEAIAHTKKD